MDNLEWKLNEVAYDYEAKEYVKITNMRCPICAQGRNHPDVFNGRHPVKGVECAREPFEAVAIRFITLNKGKAQLAFTYRGVKADMLRKTSHTMDELSIFAENPKGEHYDFIGRI